MECTGVIVLDFPFVVIKEVEFLMGYREGLLPLDRIVLGERGRGRTGACGGGRKVVQVCGGGDDSGGGDVVLLSL